VLTADSRQEFLIEGQQPGSQVSEAQIRERLRIIRPTTRWVRSFSCTDGHEHTPRIAHELGFKTLVGAWLGTDAQDDLAGGVRAVFEEHDRDVLAHLGQAWCGIEELVLDRAIEDHPPGLSAVG